MEGDWYIGLFKYYVIPFEGLVLVTACRFLKNGQNKVDFDFPVKVSSLRGAGVRQAL